MFQTPHDFDTRRKHGSSFAEASREIYRRLPGLAAIISSSSSSFLTILRELSTLQFLFRPYSKMTRCDFLPIADLLVELPRFAQDMQAEMRRTGSKGANRCARDCSGFAQAKPQSMRRRMHIDVREVRSLITSITLTAAAR